MKVPHEREIEMMPLENLAATPQQAIRRRLRTAKEMVVSTVRGVALVTVVALTGLSGTSNAQLAPEWISRVPVGTSLSSGYRRDLRRPRRRLLHHRHLGCFGQYRHHDRFVCARRIDPVDADLGQPELRCGHRKRHHERIERHSLCGGEYTR